MREPTTQRAAFEWYRAATFSDDKPPIHPDEPHCGYFAIRLVKGGPLVPARIWLHQEIDEKTGLLTEDEYLKCEIAGKPADPYEQWPRLAGYPVPFAKYRYHLNLNYYAGWNGLEIPEADPTKPIDWLKLDPPVFKE